MRAPLSFRATLALALFAILARIIITKPRRRL
jgi:hypothetical protein